MSTIDGFVIRNGYASPGTRGGGISCINASPLISGNTITANHAGDGGGIDCDEWSSPGIIDNTISGNTAGRGGGINSSGFWNAIAPEIARNVIAGNTAEMGGGIYGEQHP